MLCVSYHRKSFETRHGGQESKVRIYEVIAQSLKGPEFLWQIGDMGYKNGWVEYSLNREGSWIIFPDFHPSSITEPKLSLPLTQ